MAFSSWVFHMLSPVVFGHFRVDASDTLPAFTPTNPPGDISASVFHNGQITIESVPQNTKKAESGKKKEGEETKKTEITAADTRTPSVEIQSKTPTLGEIFRESGTDKLWRHGYHRYYETLLAPYREKEGLRLLEVGADSGYSLHAWEKYFPHASAIQGVAYNVDVGKAKAEACKDVPQCKLDIFTLDQSSPTELENLGKQEQDKVKDTQLWDIIIEDGSHVPMHQLTTFKHLFPRVRNGGVYVVEDVETSYVQKGVVYGYSFEAGIFAEPGKSAVEKFKELVDVVNRRHFTQEQYTVFGHEVDSDISEVRFVDGMVVILKKPSDPDWEKYPHRVLWPNESVAKADVRIKSELPIP